MDYTLSDSYDTHAATGNRMHEDSKAIPTAMSDKDFNQTIWSLMELVKAPGLTGVPFDPSTPSTYTKVRDAVLMLLQRMSSAVAVAGGTANAITADFTPDIATLTHGMVVRVRAAAANSSTTPTFAPDGIAAKTIVKGANAGLANGDTGGAGYWMLLSYDQPLDKWFLANPATGVAAVTGFQPLDATLTALASLATSTDQMIYSTGADTFSATTLTAFARALLDDVDAAAMRATLGISAATASAQGIVELATDAEAQTGTDTARALTAANLAAAKIQTAQTATGSGASVTLSTAIPPWVKRITVAFNGVSVSAGTDMLMRIGSGSSDAAGYRSGSSFSPGTTASFSSTTGFALQTGVFGATDLIDGHATLTHVGGNTWIESHVLATVGSTIHGGGSKTLSGVLDRVLLVPSSGNFDAGSVNIFWE